MVDIFPEEQLVVTNSVTRGHSLRYLQLLTKTDAYKYSFFPSSIRIWNSLPSDIVKAETLYLFKTGLNV